jgi:phosphatidylglycerophosphate synthase
MAPNLITFIGFTVTLSNIPLMIYYNPYFDQALPSWVLAYAGCTVFFYLTMDAIDGMQARKTKSSSPLGQLFDHGCDCAITTVFAMLMTNALGLHGSSLYVISFIVAVQVAFFLSQWEEKYTGVCRTSVGGLFGVTEAQLLLCSQMFISAWDPSIVNMVVYENLTYTECYMIFYFSFMILVSAWTIAVNVFKNPSSWVELVAILSLNGGVFLWAYRVGIQSELLWLASLILAFCNSFSTIRVIVASMTHTEFPTWHPVALPYYFILVGVMMFGQGSWLQLALAIYFGGMMQYMVTTLMQITREISAYLGIFVFNITQKRV